MFKSIIFLFILNASTFCFAEYIKKEPESAIIEQPVEEYTKYHERLKKYGLNASFPEFKAVVANLMQNLQDKNVQDLIKENKILKLQHDIAITHLLQVSLNYRMDAKNYPYPMPTYSESGYPYLPTIQAIQRVLEFFDVVERVKKDNKLPPLYHFDRYLYHTYDLLTNKDVILFPTIKNLTMEDLIRVRSVPIGFLGVTTKPIFADGHHQSSLDFYIHDFNHVRRMFAYTNKYLKDKNLKTDKAKYQEFNKLDIFIKKMLFDLTDESSFVDSSNVRDDELAIRRIIKTIMFDLFHESAINPDRKSIILDLSRRSGEPSSFEHILLDNNFNGKDDLSKIRTITGNLRSGARYILSNKASNPTVRYFFDKGTSLLSNVYQQSAYSFYDYYKTPNDNIIPTKYRKPEYIIIAAKRLYKYLNINCPSDKELYNIITSKEAVEDYQQINKILKKVELGEIKEYTEY